MSEAADNSNSGLSEIEDEIIAFFKKGHGQNIQRVDPTQDMLTSVECRHCDKSNREVSAFIASMEKKHKKYSFHVPGSEKNWISIEVFKK